MKRIFEGEIYELVAQNGNLVFTYCKSANENAVCIGYKMISDEEGNIADVAKNIYLMTKFGTNYRASSELCSNYVLARTTELSNGLLCMVADNGNTYIVDSEGMPLWSGDLKYKGENPSDIAAYKNGLWASYSESGILLRFNLMTMREELRIGGKKTPFSRPTDIFIDGNIATISNSGSKKLTEINLDSYVVTEKEEFSESVYAFSKIKNNRYVLLESGLYLL